MNDPTLVDGPFVDDGGRMFVTVDDETNRRWLREEIDSCWEAVQDEEDDLERHAEEVDRRIAEIHDERKDWERRLKEAA